MKKISKIVAIAFIGLLMVVAVFMAGGYFQPKFVEVPITVDNSEEQYSRKIEDLKNEVVAKLRACESGGHDEAYGLVTYDPKKNEKNARNIPSFGTLQFKQSTVVYYYKTLEGKDITGKEAILIALDDERSGELAKRIMFETKNLASGDWYNCAIRYNLDNEIAIIKKL